MEWVVILSGILLLFPLSTLILRSMKLMGVSAGSYYDFSPVFKNTKPWAVALYIVVIAALTLVVLLFAGLPLLRPSA